MVDHMPAERLLKATQEWAQARMAGGQEPPWSWYQLMKLNEALDEILASINATSPTGHSQQSGRRPETHLRLVADTDLRDIAQRHPDEWPVQLPM